MNTENHTNLTDEDFHIFADRLPAELSATVEQDSTDFDIMLALEVGKS